MCDLLLAHTTHAMTKPSSLAFPVAQKNINDCTVWSVCKTTEACGDGTLVVACVARPRAIESNK